MSDFQTYLWICLGVVVAVLLPVLKGLVKKHFPATMAEAVIPPWVKKYGALLVFGALTGIVVLAAWKAQNPTAQAEWYVAFLLGFSSEALLEKLVQKP
jgi:hypothetical protein